MIAWNRRPTFWNIPHWAEISQYVLGGLTVLVFLLGVYWHIRRWRLGKPERCCEPLGRRLKNVVWYGFFQGRLISDPYGAIMHLAIFWSMVVLAIGTALATVDWDVTRLFFGFQFLRPALIACSSCSLTYLGRCWSLGWGWQSSGADPVRPRALQMTACAKDRWTLAGLLGVLLLIA